MSNTGVGDMVKVLEGESVGVVLQAFDEAALASGLNALLEMVGNPNTRARCLLAAQKHFSLEEGVTKYRLIYEQLDRQLNE
jgi:hypothetical protein